MLTLHHAPKVFNIGSYQRMKPNLSTVTLLCVDCRAADWAAEILERCGSLCDFGAAKLCTSQETAYPHDVICPINSLNDYSAFMLKHAHEHVATPHMLVVQTDGWVLNPEAWDPTWLQYDYIGPLYSQEKVVNDESVGSGGFSLRSTALMAEVSRVLPPWDGKASWTGHDGRNYWAYEDGVISKGALRASLIAKGLRFAPPATAAKFAYGRNMNFFCPTPFGFHGNLEGRLKVDWLPSWLRGSERDQGWRYDPALKRPE